MARHRRSSGDPPEGPDPRDRWRDYDDDEVADDEDWADDEVDPSDDRPLPRRRRSRRLLARALAWIGGAAVLMALGALLALAPWRGSATVVSSPTPPVPVPGAADTATPGTAGSPRPEASSALDDGNAARTDTPERTAAAAPADPPASATEPDSGVSPPPLPPLPPGLDVGAPSAATRPDAAPPPEAAPRPQLPAPRQAEPSRAPQSRAPSPPTSSPAPARARPPAPPPAADARPSEEIMADFLVRSGDRAQAEATARAYAEWYAAGSAERAYWLRVLGSIRARP